MLTVSWMANRLLEVGALKPDNYRAYSSWIHCTPMDLRSRHPSIVEQDFLLMDQDEHKDKWDVISLSLVLNFVAEPKDRGQLHLVVQEIWKLIRDLGRMLFMARNMLSHKGLLFLVVSSPHPAITSIYLQLPLSCVLNSRYLTLDHLNEIMAAIGLVELKTQWKKGGKMTYWLYQKVGTDPPQNFPTTGLKKKIVLREGNRNNFSILLDLSSR